MKAIFTPSLAGPGHGGQAVKLKASHCVLPERIKGCPAAWMTQQTPQTSVLLHQLEAFVQGYCFWYYFWYATVTFHQGAGDPGVLGP